MKSLLELARHSALKAHLLRMVFAKPRSRRPGAAPGHGLTGVRQLLLRGANVAVSPGIGFGQSGEGHLRVALVENQHWIRQAVRNIRRVLERAGDLTGVDGPMIADEPLFECLAASHVHLVARSARPSGPVLTRSGWSPLRWLLGRSIY